MSMDVYVFSSTLITDIWAGIGAGLWAISAKTGQRPDVKTKAANMTAGSAGIFYLSKPYYALTTPFIVLAPPEDRQEKEVWNGQWALPFKIHPLGSPRIVFEKKDFLSTLPTLKGHTSDWDDLLMVSGTKSFVPAVLSKQDWDIIIKRLTV
jgi:hypothetical protein